MRVGIFGAGQAGLMLKTWLPSNIEVKCFIDNDNSKHGTSLDNTPVLALKDAPYLDEIIIAVLNNDIRWLQDVRLATLRLLSRQIRERNITGALAELGVYRGKFAAEINRTFPERKIYIFDTFAGFSERDIDDNVSKMSFSDTSVETVKDALPNPSQAVFVIGRFPDSLSSCQNLPETYALVSLDVDMYTPTLEGLKYFWPRLSVGGAILIHDYTSKQFPGVHKAVNEYCEEMKLFLVPLMDLHGTAVLLKQSYQ